MASTVRKTKNRKTVTKGVVKPPSKKRVKKVAADFNLAEVQEILVSTETAGQLVGMNGKWVRENFSRPKVIKTTGPENDLRVRLGDFLPAAVDYYRNMVKTGQASRRTSVADIRAAKAARHLVETDNVVELFTSNHNSLRAELEGIAAQVTRDLELRKKIQDAIYAALRRHHERIQRQLETEEEDFST